MRPSSSDRPLLAVEGLNRRFGDIEAVRELTLSIRRGERVALRGPNGSGKSTVLRAVAGTVSPTRGRVQIDGHPAGSTEASLLTGTSFSQERSFYLRLSGQDNLLFFARLRHPASRAAARVREIGDELELPEILRRRADACSSGMLQQLSFARALLGEPALLVLDEPTRSLDEGARQRFWDALDRRPEVAVIMATHSDEEALRCGSQVDLPR
jgi:ABC-type multidrug transport system ATPase subunit